MTVYADVLFIINFIFDAEILMILLRLYSKKIPALRLLLSTCIGGLQGIFVFIPYFRILCSPPARFLVPFVMVCIVFLPCKTGELISVWTSFLAISFVFSGAITFFHMKAVYGLLLMLPLYVMIVLIKRNIKRKKSQAILVYKDKKISEDGFFDSGNTLFYNEAPVMLANSNVFIKLFGDGFSPGVACEWIDVEDICFIPYTSLGSEGVIFGIKLEYALIGEKRYDNAVLGYSDDKFKDNLILNSTMT